MSRLLSLLLPRQAGSTLPGSQIPLYVLALVALIGTVRSFIHMFAPDGGAGSIAGMDLTGSGAGEVVFAFALWGSAQLVYALAQWAVILRYRSLVPLMWMLQLVETSLRILVGQVKPVSFDHTPPGAYQNTLYLILGILMLALTVWSARNTAQSAKERVSPVS